MEKLCKQKTIEKATLATCGICEDHFIKGSLPISNPCVEDIPSRERMTDCKKNDEWLPCPFCMSAAKFKINSDRPNYHYKYVECIGCGAKHTPEKWNIRVDAKLIKAQVKE